MRKKTSRILFILSLTLIMLLIPLSAQASCGGEYTTYNYGAILQMMRSNLGQQLSANSCNQTGTAGEVSVNSLPKQLDFFNLYDITRSYNSNAGGSCGVSSGSGGSCGVNSAYGGSCGVNSGSGSACGSGDCSGSTCNGKDCSDSACYGNTCSGNSCSANTGSGNSCSANTGSGSSCGSNSVKATYYTSANGRGANQQSASNSSPAVSVPTIVQQVVDLVNAERAKEGLAALTLDASLCNGAAIRVNEISTLFSHTRPNGQSCFTALDEAGVNYRQAGENIALGQTSAQQVMEDWMNSPGHRANIMSANYSRIGVAMAASGDSRYGGYAWAQEFAN